MGNYNEARDVKYERGRFRSHVDREVKMKKNAVMNTILLSSLFDTRNSMKMKKKDGRRSRVSFAYISRVMILHRLVLQFRKKNLKKEIMHQFERRKDTKYSLEIFHCGNN